MFNMQRVDNIARENKILTTLRKVINRTGSLLEFLVFLSIWLLVFMNRFNIGDFSRTEIITYLIFGNLIGLITGFFLLRIIQEDVQSKESDLLIYRPLEYLAKVIARRLLPSLFPFIVALILHLLVLYFFINEFLVNLDIETLAVIGIMILFSFVIEFLLVYLAKLFIFWSWESEELYNNIIRLKKFFAGNFIPLSLLPAIYLQVGLFLPFAYSFYVPTELYLGKISLNEGLRGLEIQIIWIIALYFIVRYFWQKKVKKGTVFVEVQ